MRLLIATTNQNKLHEIRAVLRLHEVEILTLADVPRIAEPDETGNSFWENARQKAFAYARASGIATAAEDSGLEIRALGAEPGIRSARFLGADVPYAARFEEIYRRLSALGAVNRDARFVTALAVVEPDGAIVFECEAYVDGVIADAPKGSYGFGYDPIFVYPPLGKTTAELTLDEKCAISHRARAFRDFVTFARKANLMRL